MLGGGNWVSQNKTLPGTYINFISAASAKQVLSERGIAAVALTMDWGPEKEVFEVTAEEFRESCFEIFGHSVEDQEMLPLRELFLNLTKGVFYRLNSGVKASNSYAEARFGGTRGNDITIVISANVDDNSKFDVKTVFAGKEVDKQTVASASELKENGYVTFKTDTVLTAAAGTPLTGGTNGNAVTGDDHMKFLNKMESYHFHILCCPSTDDAVKALYAAYTKRMREEAGVKFQTVMYRKSDEDYEGVISVENKASELDQGLVYWTAGAEAACAVNKTNENKTYNGELTVDTEYTQKQLSDGIRSGKFLFHKCGDKVKVLMDINTLTTYTDDHGADFGNNQTVRVLDQIGNDIASIFNDRYLGSVPNDASGRTSLWNDIVTYGKELAAVRAIEEVAAKEITVEAGSSKRSVTVNFPVTPINCMSQLYMTVVVE